MPTFNGIWPALITPLTPDSRLNPTALQSVVKFLVDKGADGLYVLGATGQGLYFSIEERKRITELVMQQVGWQRPVIVQVGSPVLGDAIELAKHAAENGVAGISSLIPPGFSDRQTVLAYYRQLAEAIPDLPLLPYFWGDSAQSGHELLKALVEIPNIAGVKYTSPNLFEFKKIVDLRTENWSVFSGYDEQSAYAAMTGSSGHIGSTLNFIPGVYKQIRQLILSGEHTAALDLQFKANRVTALCIEYGFMAAIREVMRLLGLDCGQPRLPAPSFPELERPIFEDKLRELGFFELAEM
ncbi:MAG: dihydrodipicolinate synthase family protein [Anaerolineales bacterium]|nr:dihydrodipicolinate synthase family protein [Anaerolineales bacterium]